jgi:serine/threonine-protein kinase
LRRSEQAQGLATIDHRTDIWSLGAVLYEALAGAPAYPEAKTYEEVIMKILLERPKPLLEVAPWVPPELAEVIGDALQHDVKRRIPDCQAFANRLASAVPSAIGVGSSGLFSVARSVRAIDSAPKAFTPMGVRPSYSMPASDTPNDTQVVIRAGDSGPESFDEGSPASATMIAPASVRGDLPPKVVARPSQHDDSLRDADANGDPTMFQAPAWVGGGSVDGPMTLRTAVRSVATEVAQARGIVAAAATALAVIVVGGALLLISRAAIGTSAPSESASASSANAAAAPPPEMDDIHDVKPAAPPPTGTGVTSSEPPPLAPAVGTAHVRGAGETRSNDAGAAPGALHAGAPSPAKPRTP